MGVERLNGYILAIVTAPYALSAYPQGLERVIYEDIDYGNRNVVYNPPWEELEKQILASTASALHQPPSELGLTKANTLALIMAFTDTHENHFPAAFINNEILPVVSSILNLANNEDRTVTVPEQFQLILEQSRNNVLLALMRATLVNRVMARAWDAKLVLGFKPTNDLMGYWRKAISPFENYSDPPGDTYHLYEAALLGYVSTYQPENLYHTLTAGFAGFLLRYTPEITEILRHKLAGRNGKTHGDIDSIGFNLGQKIAATRNSHLADNSFWVV